MTGWGGAVPAGERDEGRERRAARALVLVFIVLATGIIGASFLYYRSYEQRYRLEVERQLSAIAQLKVSELVQDRKERLGDAVVFYRNAAFSALARRYLENPQDAEAEAERPLRAWLKKVQEYYQYNRVSLLNARGEERMSVPNPQPIAAVLSRRVAEVLQSGQVGFQDFYRSEHDQRIYLALLVPIFDEPEGGPALGVLALRIDPERYLYPYINRWPTPSRTAETLLVRRDGNDALFLNELRFQKNTALNLRVSSPYCGSGTTASASI